MDATCSANFTLYSHSSHLHIFRNRYACLNKHEYEQPNISFSSHRQCRQLDQPSHKARSRRQCREVRWWLAPTATSKKHFSPGGAGSSLSRRLFPKPASRLPSVSKEHESSTGGSSSGGNLGQSYTTSRLGRQSNRSFWTEPWHGPQNEHCDDCEVRQ